MNTTLIVIVLGIALLAIVALPSLFKRKSDADAPPSSSPLPARGTDIKPTTCGTANNFPLGTAEEIDRMPLARWLCEQASAQTGIDLKHDRMALTRIMEAAKKAQTELDANSATEVSLPYITADANGPKHFQIVVTRDKVATLRSRML